MTTPPKTPEELIEAVARLLDPKAWKARDHYTASAAAWHAVEPGGRLDLQFTKQAADLVEPSLTKAREITALLDDGDLRKAAEELLATMSDNYKARNGRVMGIEGDDGEKCWIVHSDQIEALRSALQKGDQPHE